MDQNTRNTLRNVVTQCRRLLEDSVAQVLQGQFGIFAVGKKDEVQIEPEARMSHLSEEDRAYRQDLLDHFEHIKALGYKAKDALAQLIREVAFTHLNRFCAYRMMESRGLIREAVSKGLKSQGFLFYLADHEEDERRYNTGQQDLAYRHFLNWLGGTLSEEIGVLFAPTDPANRLYPPQRVIDEVLGLLNDPELGGIWSEDEAIGWVYQYFTPKELRDQARKESQAPRNSYELAFRNQFFTPRYVVEFLTDNTLGRIWYEMRRGDTRLKDQCRYMVRRPAEVFLSENQKEPEGAASATEDLSQEELLKLPVYIPFRAKKDPRELRIIDPACGSGHFLLYCFDLLLTIYEEAYSDPDLGPALEKDYPSLDDLRRDAPRLILTYNLHGIDIDLRASQIAALALWLRGQRAYQEMEIKQNRPKITRSNIVCAEPMPGEAGMLKDFVQQLEPKVLGQVVEVVFGKMTLAGEAGSLLRIEEEIRGAVAAAKKQYARETANATDRKGRPLLFTEAEMSRISGAASQPSLFDISDITDAQFFEQAEAKVVEALRLYAEKTHDRQQLHRRLFSDDAVRGFAFVDLCQKRYDVILMNPPFGPEPARSASAISSYWPAGRHDLATAFVDMSRQRLLGCGAVGVIMTRTPFFLSRFTEWRESAVYAITNGLSAYCDLGQGVLDTAMVEASLAVFGFAAQMPLALDARQQVAERSADPIAVEYFRPFSLSALANLPNKPLAYWIPRTTINAFARCGLYNRCAEVKQGLATKDNERFVRLWAEVPQQSLFPAGTWRVYAKGGEYRRHYLPLPLVVDWSPNALAEYQKRKGQKVVLLTGKSEAYLSRPGLTYSKRSQIGFSARVMPTCTVFSPNGPGIFPSDTANLLFDLAVLNTPFVSACLGFMTSFGSFSEGYVESLPYPTVEPDIRSNIAALELEAVLLTKSLAEMDETNREFTGHDLMPPESLREAHARRTAARTQIADAISSIEKELQQRIEELYGLSEEDKTFVARSGQGHYRVEEEEETEDAENDNDNLLSEDLQATTRIVVSYLHGVVLGRWNIDRQWSRCSTPQNADVFEALPEQPPAMISKQMLLRSSTNPDPDGILVDDEQHSDDVPRRIRSILESLWGHNADVIEQEACDHLGVKCLRDYFRKPGKGGFWDDHISRYSKSRRKAPIYWLLQSSKKNYAIWLYYHRLDKDILFKALVNYVEPKIRLENDRLESLRSQKASGGAGKGAKKLDKDIEKQEEFLSELRDFEEKLRRAADLHLVPDLNDGVVLNIAPLHELVPWKEAEKYWEELLEGKYEWSSIGKQLREKGLVK